MNKYRKKPVIIEANVYQPGMEDGFEQFTVSGLLDAKCNALVKSWYGDVISDPSALVHIPFIQTLEGKHYVTKGDYIITGIQGERYPCKPDIFEATYDKVAE